MLALGLGLVLSGCMTIEEMAPPVEGTVIQAASDHGADIESLQRGRALYLNQCIRCHGVEAVDRYSDAKWRELMPEMADEAKLNAHQEQDVLLYVLIARQAKAIAASQPTP